MHFGLNIAYFCNRTTVSIALKTLRTYILLVTLLFTSATGWAQLPVEVADSVNHYLQQMAVSEKDTDKRTAHNQMKKMLARVLLKTEVFQYPFSEVKQMAILNDPKGEIRVWSWYVPLRDSPAEYGCFVVRYDAKKKMCRVDELKNSDWPERAEQTALKADQWMGALYFNMLPVRSKGRDYFLLFGWNAHSELSNKKLVEVLHFQSGKLKLGLPVFLRDGKSAKRLVFEYHKDAIFTLEYSEDLKMIVFDDLGPTHPSFEGKFAQYVPLQTFSGYKQNKGQWELERDVDFRRSKKEKDGPFNDPGKPDFKRERNGRNPLTGE